MSVVSRNTGVTQPSIKQGYAKRKRGMASLDTHHNRATINKSSPDTNTAADIFTNDLMTGSRTTVNNNQDSKGKS